MVVGLGLLAGLPGCAESGQLCPEFDFGPDGVPDVEGMVDVGDDGEEPEPGDVDGGVDGGGDVFEDDVAGGDDGEEGDTGPVRPGYDCQSCEDDAECGSDYFCVQLAAGGGGVCLRSCDEELPDCPPRFDCVESRITPLPTAVCAPVGERCCVDADYDDYGSGIGCRGPDCDDSNPRVNPEEPEACDWRDNDCDGATDEDNPGGGAVCITGLPGACAQGVTSCEGGLLVCNPVDDGTPEECDGLDNDCNGWIDEDPGTLRALTRGCYDGPAGTEGVGACAAGMQTCAGGEYRACVGQILPVIERCDGVDEDCDTVVDDGDPGGGIPCTAPAPGVCADGVTRCVDGAVTCVSTIAPGSQPELCDALDNDCDGVVNNGFPDLNTVCFAGTGACRRAGLRVCDPADAAGPPICDAVPGTPAAAERCDHEDDDCDGATDEGYTLGQVCTEGIGACLRTGVTICDAAGTGVECSVSAGAPSGEVCDSLDNDCDGSTDEGFADLGTVCFDGVGACRRAGIRICNGADPTGAPICDAVPGAPSAAERCDHEDDDCDGATDEGYALGQVCTVGVGACARSGVTICNAAGTGVQCDATPGTPAAELCDTLDNDCDGSTNEDFPGLGTACFNGVGACRRVGVQICNPANPAGAPICDAVPGTPSPVETCDYEDDDCDGSTDEGYALGQVCTVGVGACARSGVSVCRADGTGVQCSATAGTPSTEICDGLDNDCDGTTNEGFSGLGTVCFVGVGACLRSGVNVCRADGLAVECNATAGTPTSERCDGVDNDCDGSTDEGYALGQVCTVGVGACARSGVTICNAAGTGVQCDATPGTPAAELCDTLDNDCDGSTNEDFPGLGTACFNGVGACRRVGVQICNPANPAGAPICDAVPGTPSPVETCDYEDDDCDGSTDEGYALGQVCTVGVGACARSGVSVCRADGTGVQCSATAGTPSTEICDGLDNDCDGLTNEGFAGLGTACLVGTGACLRSGVNVCRADGSGVECNAVPGAPTSETCDHVDNDCDGSTDEGYALGQVCTVGVGACARSGVTICNAAGTGVQCDATAGTPTSETCNRVDDDCDGSTDEGFYFSGDPLNPGVNYPLGSACAIGLGVCRRGGVVVCSGSGASAVCDAPVVPPGSETCNYLDDDCDGTVDDGYVNAGGVYYQNTNCGACGIDCTAIYALPGAYGTCQVSGSSATCVMNCSSGYFNLNGIPDDGCEFQLDTGAIYVSGEDWTAVDDAGCGLGPTATGGGRYPCRTITYGISRATAAGRSRVLVADALYVESVTLVAGRSLLGGYRPDTWERHLTTTLTTIRAPAGAGHRKTITATGISSATTVEGFVIEGTSATTAGANSYAVYVNGGTSALTFSNNTIYAGSGAPGSTGAAGTDGAGGVAGTAGQDAFDTGSTACSTSRAGPAGGARTCGGTVVNGGAGGGVQCPPRRDTAPHSALAGGAGSGTGGGAGGARAYDGETDPYYSCNLCTLPPNSQTMTGGNGAAGANGTHGAAGAGAASAVGSISANEWVGAGGGTGAAGTHGAGGGGGGAGGGGDGLVNIYGSCTDDLGATGGGGGSGACAGTAGSGGGAGGGSFGIFVVNTASPPTLTGNTIYRGFGGAGGNGGRGGVGGTGGAGAAGGLKSNASSSFCTGDGGHGGNGGNGGHGGGGGGGAGGVSYGIYVAGMSGYGAGTNTFPASGGGGAGGGGGPSLGNSGGAGVAGASGNTN